VGVGYYSRDEVDTKRSKSQSNDAHIYRGRKRKEPSPEETRASNVARHKEETHMTELSLAIAPLREQQTKRWPEHTNDQQIRRI